MISKILSYVTLLKMFGFHIIYSDTSSHITGFQSVVGKYYNFFNETQFHAKDIQGTVVLGRLHKLSNSVGDPNRKNTIQYRSTWRRYMFYVDYLLCKITEVVHFQLIFFVFLSRNSEVRSFLETYDRSQPPPNGKQEPTI